MTEVATLAQSCSVSSALESRLDSATSTLEGKLDSATSTLESRLDSATSSLESRLDSARSTLEDRLDSSTSTLEGRLDSATSTLEGRLDSATSTLEGRLDSATSTLAGSMEKPEKTRHSSLPFEAADHTNLHNHLHHEEHHVDDQPDTCSTHGDEPVHLHKSKKSMVGRSETIATNSANTMETSHSHASDVRLTPCHSVEQTLLGTDKHSQCTMLEQTHVHDVYDKMAHHFQDTRYRAWPKVRHFLSELEPASLVADVGGYNNTWCVHVHSYSYSNVMK